MKRQKINTIIKRMIPTTGTIRNTIGKSMIVVALDGEGVCVEETKADEDKEKTEEEEDVNARGLSEKLREVWVEV